MQLWARCGVDPRPSACKADVMPLHHAPKKDLKFQNCILQVYEHIDILVHFERQAGAGSRNCAWDFGLSRAAGLGRQAAEKSRSTGRQAGRQAGQAGRQVGTGTGHCGFQICSGFPAQKSNFELRFRDFWKPRFPCRNRDL